MRAFFSFFVTLVVHLPLLAVEDEGKSFEALLAEIARLNNVDPSLAEERAGPVRRAFEREPARPDTIRLQALLAPADSREKGYEAVREELETLLRKVPEFAEDTEEGDLMPRLALALGDLAYRYGDLAYGLSQLQEGLWGLPGDEATRWRQRLQVKASEILLAGGHYEQAQAMLSDIVPELRVSDPESVLKSCLLKASAERLLGNLKASRASLEKASSKFSPGTALQDLGAYWIENIWHALEEGALDKARRYLDEALRVGTRSASLRVQADGRFLSAVMGILEGRMENRSEIREILQSADRTYREAVWEVRYPEMLERALALPGLADNRWARVPLLEESASFARQALNLPARAAGLAARGELAVLMGESGEEVVIVSFRESIEEREAYLRTVGAWATPWNGLEPAKEKKPGLTGASLRQRDLFYELLILLVFSGIVLVLWNRIRVQRHLNQQLEDSVEQAKTSEQAAEESNRMKSEFLANVSHEMKTPMGGIVGMASLLEELITDPRQRKYLATIRTCSENLLVLMNDLLDLGRMESGVVEIESHPMEVRTAVGFSIEMVRQAAEEKGLALEWELDDAVPETVLGDSTRISQVLSNLLTNAIKFTENGSIHLRVHFQPTLGSSGNLVFAVSDTGRGIPPEKLETVFEPFHRGLQVSHHDPGGNGLGLAICRKLVDLMGGTLSARSEEGVGSVFTVTLPVRA